MQTAGMITMFIFVVVTFCSLNRKPIFDPKHIIFYTMVTHWGASDDAELIALWCT
jgi:hypothetical protein